VSRASLAAGWLRDPVAYLAEEARRFGPVATLAGGRHPVVLVTDPELVKEILEAGDEVFDKAAGNHRLRDAVGDGLQFSGGEHHRVQRERLDPLFGDERVARYADAVTESVGQVTAGWREGDAIDVVADMRRIATGAILGALFGNATDADVDRLTDSVTELARGLWLAMVPGGRTLARTPARGFRRFARAGATIDEYVRADIAGRESPAPDDLVGEMLAAGLSPREARDEVMTLLLAGRGTLTAALAWTWLLLAENPSAAERVRTEADDVLEGRDPSAKDLAQLTFTRKAFDEALRLYPPAWVLRRKAVHERTVGGVRIPSGATLLLCPFVVHRDARIHPDPLRFDPDRQDPERSYATFPFGGGPRGCIGARFAWMEATLVIAAVASRWQLELPDGHPPEIRFARGITLLPRDPLLLRLERRAEPSIR